MVRDAIDLAHPSGDDARRRALREFLAITTPATGRGESWAEIKRDMEDTLDDELSR